MGTDKYFNLIFNIILMGLSDLQEHGLFDISYNNSIIVYILLFVCSAYVLDIIFVTYKIMNCSYISS